MGIKRPLVEQAHTPTYEACQSCAGHGEKSYCPVGHRGTCECRWMAYVLCPECGGLGFSIVELPVEEEECQSKSLTSSYGSL